MLKYGISFAAICFLISSGTSSATSVSDKAWEAIETMQFQDAENRFRKILEEEQDSTEAQLGIAMSLLGKEPTGGQGFTRAVNQLQALLAGNADNVNADVSQAALLLSRCHTVSGDFEKAEEVQQFLSEKGLGIWKDEGILALIELSLSTADQDTLGEAISKGEIRLHEISNASIRSRAHIAIGERLIRSLGANSQGLHHLESALECGIKDMSLRGDLLVSAGNLALSSGEPSSSLNYWKIFLQDYPLDGRATEIRNRVDSLKKEGTDSDE